MHAVMVLYCVCAIKHTKAVHVAYCKRAWREWAPDLSVQATKQATPVTLSGAYAAPQDIGIVRYIHAIKCVPIRRPGISRLPEFRVQFTVKFTPCTSRPSDAASDKPWRDE